MMEHLPEEIDVLFQEWLRRNVDEYTLTAQTGRSLLKMAFRAGYDARLLPVYSQYDGRNRDNGPEPAVRTGNPGHEAATGFHQRPRLTTVPVHNPRAMPDPGFRHTETVYDGDGSADHTGFMPLARHRFAGRDTNWWHGPNKCACGAQWPCEYAPETERPW